MYKIERELHPAKQRIQDQKMKCAFCMYPIYTSNNGLSMLEIRNNNEMWRSEDNGVSWTFQEQLPDPQKLNDGTYCKWAYGPFFYDTNRELLIQFVRNICYRCPPIEVKDYHMHKKMYVEHSPKTFYRISHDGGLTWNKQRQLIEDGDEYDEHYYAKGYLHGKNTLTIGEVPPYMTLDDGHLMLPFQGWCHMEMKQFGRIQASRLFGRWDDKLNDYRWVSGGRVPGGGCEQTIVRLKDGRLFNILRNQGSIEPYYFDTWFRPYSLSEDNGKTWSIPKPLCWDNGENLTSPRAWSQLIRANNGCLYWIANILPALDKINSLKNEWPNQVDPRYPLVIAEVEEQTLTLKHNTATTIIDREPEDTKFVRFSNFHCYNDRLTDEIVILMTKSYNENQPELENMPHPAWRFRIQVSTKN